MAKREIRQGELYFIRERAPEGGFGPYVKIGLVRYSEGRDSYNRLVEHQTGNPRELHLDPGHIVVTPAVDRVEALMHRVFSHARVSGEWFHLPSDKAVDDAVGRAREMANEAETLAALLEQAAGLEDVESDGSMRVATAEDRENHATYWLARSQQKRCDDLKGQIRDLLTRVFEEGGDISDAGKEQVREYKPRLMKDALKARHPELWKKYLVSKDDWYQRFTATAIKDPSALPEDPFATEIEAIGSQIAAFGGRDELLSLNEPNLALDRLGALALWTRDVAEANLKIAVDTAGGIEGVCTWPRRPTVLEKFNEEAFALENPDLALEFLSSPKKVTVILTKPTVTKPPRSAGKAKGKPKGKPKGKAKDKPKGKPKGKPKK